MSFRQVSGPTLADIERQLRQIASGQVQQKAMGAAGRVLADAQRQAFGQEASPAGVPWQPLRKARPGKILHRGGALEAAATRPLFRGNVVSFLLPPYGARQHFGYPKGALDHPPPRPFMALDPLPFSVQQRLTREINEMFAQRLR